MVPPVFRGVLARHWRWRWRRALLHPLSTDGLELWLGQDLLLLLLLQLLASWHGLPAACAALQIPSGARCASGDGPGHLGLGGDVE